MKAADAERQAKLAELNGIIAAQKAAEQKAKDDAEREAQTAKRIQDEIAKVKAQLAADQKAKELADAQAKYDAEVAAAAAAKAKAEKEAAEAAAKAAFEEGLKAKYEAEKKAAEDKAAEEVAKAKAEADAAKAALPPTEEKKKPIKFKDALGRKFSFPFHLCQTWKGMNELICQAFMHVEPIGRYVQEGHFDLVGPNGEIILPQIWETMIEPDWAITMHMWPMPEKKEESPPPPGPQIMHAMPGRKRAGGPARGRDRAPPTPPMHPGPGPGVRGDWIGPPPGVPGVSVLNDDVPKPPKKKTQSMGWSIFGAPPKKSSKK